MTDPRPHAFVHVCSPIPDMPSLSMAVSEEISVALELLEAVLHDAYGFACEDGVVMAACLNNHLFERIATLGQAMMDHEPDNDFEPDCDTEKKEF